jgi:hypothetical protein
LFCFVFVLAGTRDGGRKRYKSARISDWMLLAEDDVRTAAAMVRITTLGRPDLAVVCDEEERGHSTTAVLLLGAGRN